MEGIEKNLFKTPELFRQYGTMAKDQLPENIKTVILVELCAPDLREHLEFIARDTVRGGQAARLNGWKTESEGLATLEGPARFVYVKLEQDEKINLQNRFVCPVGQK